MTMILGSAVYLHASELPALPPRSAPSRSSPSRPIRPSGEIPLILPWICPCGRPDAVGCPECCIDNPGLYLPAAEVTP